MPQATVIDISCLHIQHEANSIMQVVKWGNSLAIRLPVKIVRQLGLKEGDSIKVHATGMGLRSPASCDQKRFWHRSDGSGDAYPQPSV